MKIASLKLLFLLGFAFCVVPLQAQKIKYSTLKPNAFKIKIERAIDPCIIDIRSAVNYEAGHIAGAVNLDPNDLRFIAELKRLCSQTDPVFVYCKMGKTSKAASKTLAENGFKDVYNLKGGVTAWLKHFPVVTE
ncbi:MAG: rhodanese-like domain-containing protein [Bacteroidales bacterium]|nr:rhodanese-like domain-containing protein [Bacteroidales bacterium]